MSVNNNLETSLSLLQDFLTPEKRDQAWAKFVDRYRGKILDWSRHQGLQEADAEDLTQQLFLDIPAKMAAFRYERSRGSFRGWLKTVVRNAARDCLRRRGREQPLESDLGQTESSVNALVELLDADFQRELLQTALARVRDRVSAVTWESFDLTVMQGRPPREVAAQLGIAVAHLYVYKGRVQKLLQEEMTDLNGTRDEQE